MSYRKVKEMSYRERARFAWIFKMGLYETFQIKYPDSGIVFNEKSRPT